VSTVLRDVVLVKPWTTDEFATALGISADKANDLLIGMGLDQDTQGRWWPNDDEVTVAVIEHVLAIAYGYHATTGRRDEPTCCGTPSPAELRRNG
jgi:hypothetical protein